MDTGTGEVTGRCFSRRRTSEFLKFMDEVAARHPSQEAHVILDNLSTHSGPQVNKWLSKHQNFTFHYTPSRQLVAKPGGDMVRHHHPPGDRQRHIRLGPAAHPGDEQLCRRTLNEDSAPFEWTATAADIIEKVALVDRDFRKLLACNL